MPTVPVRTPVMARSGANQTVNSRPGPPWPAVLGNGGCSVRLDVRVLIPCARHPARSAGWVRVGARAVRP